MTMETPFPVTKQVNCIDTYPKRSFGCQCVPKPEFENKKKMLLSSLVPKLKFGNAMTMETPFPVTKQVNCTDTSPKRSFKCQCVPKPEFGNKKKMLLSSLVPKLKFSLVPKLKFGNAMILETPFPVTKQVNCTDTYPKRSFGCQCVPKPEFGNKRKFPPSFPN